MIITNGQQQSSLVLDYFYHNILINVKKKYYILYIGGLIGNFQVLYKNSNLLNVTVLTNEPEIAQ